MRPEVPVLQFSLDDPRRPAVRELIAEHLADMYATSPADSVHALDVVELRRPGLFFWTAGDGDRLLACGALKQLSPTWGELKSMRTAEHARGRGVGGALLKHLLDQAAARGFDRVSLETGSQPYFEPARRLYARHGFVECGPFADYAEDPHSVFMTRSI